MSHSDDAIVRQDNSLVNFSYRLNTVEQKIVRILLSQLRDNEDDAKTLFSLTVKELSEAMSIDRTDNPYSFLTSSLHSLQDKSIYPDKKNRKLRIKWFASVEDLGNGIFEVEISDKLLPFLIDLSKQYTQYKLRFVINFDSTHAFRLYELCKQYEQIGQRQIEVSELKWILGIENLYPRYYDFRKKVLIPSITNINDKSDILVDYIEIKTRKTTHSLKFIIKKNKDNLPPRDKAKDIIRRGFNVPLFDDTAKMLFERFQIPKTQAAKLSYLWHGRQADLESLCDKIKNRYNAGHIKNSIAAYAAKVIREEGSRAMLL